MCGTEISLHPQEQKLLCPVAAQPVFTPTRERGEKAGPVVF